MSLVGPGSSRSIPDRDLFERFLAAVPAGYTSGLFEGKRWSATKKPSADGRRIWLFAEELGANGIVSFNAYRLTDGTFLVKPCEMSMTKVEEFVLGYRFGDDADGSGEPKALNTFGLAGI